MSAFRAATTFVRVRLNGRADAWSAALVAALTVSVLLAACVGASRLPLHEIVAALFDPARSAHGLLWTVRLPRIALGALVGACLAFSGVLLQTALRNPLADPGLLGVSAGGGAAALIAILFFPEHAALLPLFAFGGGLLAVTVVLAIGSLGANRLEPLRTVLGGVALQALLFAVIALLSFLFAERAPAFMAFLVGSLAGRGAADLALVWPVALGGCLLALPLVRRLDILLLDDASASGVGLDVMRTRFAAAGLAALLSASAVAVAGLVSFVGLVVPNGVRLAVSPRHAVLLPLSALAGATLVVAADTAARTVAAPLELPVGALLAVIGAPVLLRLLWMRLA